MPVFQSLLSYNTHLKYVSSIKCSKRIQSRLLNSSLIFVESLLKLWIKTNVWSTVIYLLYLHLYMYVHTRSPTHSITSSCFSSFRSWVLEKVTLTDLFMIITWPNHLSVIDLSYYYRSWNKMIVHPIVLRMGLACKTTTSIYLFDFFSRNFKFI